MAESKPQVDNGVKSNSEMKAMVAVHIDWAAEQMFGMEISALVAESLGDILMCPYENAITGVRSVICNVFEQVLLNIMADK